MATVEFDAWVERARAVPIESEVVRRGYTLRRSGAERIGPCPRCGGVDRFSINVKENVWNCRQCKPENIAGDIIGLVEWLDGCEFVRACETLNQEPPPLNGHAETGNGQGSREVAWYDYVDEVGALLFQVVRFEPKDFRQRKPNVNGGSGWDWSTKGVRQVPFQLPDLIEGIALEHIIYVVEGEKDVLTLAKLGLTATCNAMGAGNWRSSLNQYFKDADVVIIADHDPQTTNKKTGEKLFHPDGRPKFAGFDHAMQVAAELKPIAYNVRMFDIAELWPACGPKGDITDYIEAGGSVEALIEFVARCESWTPAKAKDKEKEPSPGIFIEPTAYVLPDPSTIPPRAWIYGTHYIRGTVTSTVAPGGFGKTTLALYEALYMVCRGYRVWYISGEDDKAEIDRRIAAHRKLHPNDGPLDDRLFVDDKLSFPFKIAKSGRNGPEFDEAKLKAFEEAIQRRKIDVVILDPFVSFHLLAESDTAAMDALVKRLGDIGSRCQCCIELAHHVRKPGAGQFELTVYDARGAVAIVNAVRSCRVLNQMSTIEAQQVKIEIERRSSYIRIDSGKRNMAPPERARWMQLLNQEIANGDHVQALKVYDFRPETASEEDKEWVRLTLKTGTYRGDSRSPDWFGKAVARHFNREAMTKGDIKWINRQITEWENKGLIRKVYREDEHRHSRQYIELVESRDVNDARTSPPVGEDDD